MMNFENPFKPPRLVPGDTIGIAAPAGPFDMELFSKGVHVLEQMGFNVYVPQQIFHHNKYLAGTDAQRVSILHQLFSRPDIKAIVCARGGYGSLRILPMLHLDVIRQHPKIFVGFSDITAILGVLAQAVPMVTFHGPMVTTLASATSRTQQAWIEALVSENPIQYACANGITIKPGKAVGPVYGGNLCTICHLIGTPYVPDLSGRILIIEDINEPIYKIDRMLTQMKMAGMFHHIAGLVLGTFTNCGSEATIRQIVAECFADDDIPILYGMEVGHGAENLMFPLGLEAMLDADRHVLSYTSAATLEVNRAEKIYQSGYP